MSLIHLLSKHDGVYKSSKSTIGKKGVITAKIIIISSLGIDTLDINMVETVKERLEEFIESKGFDPKIHVLYARISKRGYMPYEQGIMLEDGRDVSEHSAMIRSLSLPNERAMVFVPEAVRDEAELAVREWIKPSQSSLSQFS